MWFHSQMNFHIMYQMQYWLSMQMANMLFFLLAMFAKTYSPLCKPREQQCVSIKKNKQKTVGKAFSFFPFIVVFFMEVFIVRFLDSIYL